MALMHLHGLSIAHRDIKSANCLIGDRDTIKVADFGSSARSTNVTDQSGLADQPSASSLTATEMTDAPSPEALGAGMRGMRGTPYFMAPEVIKGVAYGRRSDVWSVGCTVVEMVTGKPPWSDLGNHVAVHPPRKVSPRSSPHVVTRPLGPCRRCTESLPTTSPPPARSRSGLKAATSSNFALCARQLVPPPLLGASL